MDGEYNDIRWGESIAGYEIVCSVTTNTSITARPKVIFSYVLGSGLKTIDEFNATNTTVLFGRNIQKINARQMRSVKMPRKNSARVKEMAS